MLKKKKNGRRKEKKKPVGNFFKCGADVHLDLRLIALKIYWSKGQGCVRVSAEGIKFMEGNKDVPSTGAFQLKVNAASVSGTTTKLICGYGK